MATTLAKEEELQSKHVQELAADGEEPPRRYIFRDAANHPPIDVSPPLLPVPIVDLERLFSSSSNQADEEEEEGEELQKLRSALASCGCFQAIGHGISSSFLDKMREVAKEFFRLPMEEKLKCSKAVDGPEGYGNDQILSEKQVLDWTDRLYLYTLPEDQRKLQFWPENPSAFRELLEEYTRKIKMIMELLFKAMARSLNLEENCFLNQFGGRSVMLARFNLYPPCSRPDLVLGLKPHADGSGITVVLQDKEVEGLQILKDDQWVRVPIMPHALLVNLGDQMEIMSNGVFKSPVHRVVTNSERERMSLAMFDTPEPGREIGPTDEMINEERPRLFKNVKNYTDIYFENYQQGKRPIDAVRI